MKTRLLLGIVFLLTTVLFFLQNSATIAVNFLFFSNIELSIGSVIIVSVVLGMIIMYGFFSIIEGKYKKTIRIKSKHINKLKREISKLNNEKFGENVILDDTSNELYERFLQTIQQEDALFFKNDDMPITSDEFNTVSDLSISEKKIDDVKNIDSNENFKKNFSGFDEIENFSIKTSVKKEEEEPWFNKPFFKRKSDLDLTIKKQDKITIDEIISANIDDIISKNKNQKKIIKISKKNNKLKRNFNNLLLKKNEIKIKEPLVDILKNDDIGMEKLHYNHKNIRLSAKEYENTNKIYHENTLSVNNIKERFNWPYHKEEQEDEESIALKKLKIKKLFSNDDNLRK